MSHITISGLIGLNVVDSKCRDVGISGNKMTRKSYGGYCLIDTKLQTSPSGNIIEWILKANKLMGRVGYGITTFPFKEDPKDFDKFNEETVMVLRGGGGQNDD